jgi:adenylate cyclase
MVSTNVKRKLVAILSADVEGYSRLMGNDEASTIHTLTAYKEAMTAHINQNRGRVVDAPGDNLLAEFASVVNAVQCAVEIQRELAERNKELPEKRKMAFRIGVNLGDVVEEKDRTYGDGVNIAARLENICEGGGVCISGTAFEHVGNKLDLKYEDFGDHEVKNIEKPVRVYRVQMETDSAVARLNESLELPEKPIIAVLPFTNLSGDKEQNYFSDGLTEEIMTTLSKLPNLLVIDRYSTFTYKGKPVKVKQVAEELGVSHMLEGSVRKAGDKVRITAQLIDTLTGHHLWSERYDRALKDIFEIQDQIAMNILTALQVKLTHGEQARVLAKGTKNLEALEKFWQGLSHLWLITQESNIIAREIAKEAIALDPEYPAPYFILGFTHLSDVWFAWTKTPQVSLESAYKLGKKIVALDDSWEIGHLILSMVYILIRQHEKAIAEGKRAVSLSPNGSMALWSLAEALRYSGRHKEAIAGYKKALRLSPFPPGYYFYGLARSYFFMGQYEEAITASKKALQSAPDSLPAHYGLAAIYALAGREKEASDEVDEVYRINPKFSIDHVVKIFPFKKQEEKEVFINALRKAGLK